MTLNIKQLLSTTPETLAEQQREALLREVQSTFSRLVTHLQKDEFQHATGMLGTSPAGDGYGCDNRCVNFDHVMERIDRACFADIGDVIDKLKSLSAHAPKATKR